MANCKKNRELDELFDLPGLISIIKDGQLKHCAMQEERISKRRTYWNPGAYSLVKLDVSVLHDFTIRRSSKRNVIWFFS